MSEVIAYSRDGSSVLTDTTRQTFYRGREQLSNAFLAFGSNPARSAVTPRSAYRATCRERSTTGFTRPR